MKKFMNKIRKNNKGFTLVELIIVVAIIAVLSAVLVPQYIQYVEKSRIGADESYISEVGHNVEIIAATNPKVNGVDVTVGVAANTGALSVTCSDSDAKAAVEEELNALFPTADRDLVSNYYTSTGVTIKYTAAKAAVVDGSGNVTTPAQPAKLEYTGAKNLK